MTNKIKIDADMSPLKQTVAEVRKEVKALANTKSSIQLISEKDKEFFKKDMAIHINLIKDKFSQTTKEIVVLRTEMEKVKGSAEDELRIRDEILKKMKEKTRLMREQRRIRSTGGGFLPPGVGGGSGVAGGGAGLLGASSTLLKGFLAYKIAKKVVSAAVQKGQDSDRAFRESIESRDRLTGLGVQSQDFGPAAGLARLGVNERQFAKRREAEVSLLGRNGASDAQTRDRLGFERANGLQSGELVNSAASLRGNFGGKGASEALARVQSSIYAAGIEDAIGPYLESMTDLLSSINSNGISNTDQLISAVARIASTDGRSIEQLTKGFQDADAGVRGSSGEANAFFQRALQRAGIGNGSIGATAFSIEAGGLLGLDRSALKDRGYSKQQLQNFQEIGAFAPLGKRSGAFLDGFRDLIGLKQNESFDNINENQQVGLGFFANRSFGTKGNGGLDTIKLLEKVEKGELSRSAFEKKQKKIREQNDPQLAKLSAVNSTLSGQTTILQKIQDILESNLGKTTAEVISNPAKKVSNGFFGDLLGFNESKPATREARLRDLKENPTTNFFRLGNGSLSRKSNGLSDKKSTCLLYTSPSPLDRG